MFLICSNTLCIHTTITFPQCLLRQFLEDLKKLIHTLLVRVNRPTFFHISHHGLELLSPNRIYGSLDTVDSLSDFQPECFTALHLPFVNFSLTRRGCVRLSARLVGQSETRKLQFPVHLSVRPPVCKSVTLGLNAASQNFSFSSFLSKPTCWTLRFWKQCLLFRPHLTPL